jgi:hypothetical protein
MKKYFRKRKHISYMQNRIMELHVDIINLSISSIDSQRDHEETVWQLSHHAVLLKKYHRRINLVRL